MKKNSLLLLIILFLVVTPLIFLSQSDFAGADTKALEVIEEIAPSYQPWITNIWKPNSGEVESLLFALQAALGAIFIGYFIGFSRAKLKYQTRNDRS